jgi:hypothetical protein
MSLVETIQFFSVIHWRRLPILKFLYPHTIKNIRKHSRPIRMRRRSKTVNQRDGERLLDGEPGPVLLLKRKG